MNKQPNWNEAPDGATLFWTNPISYDPWFKIENGMLYNFDNLDRMWCCMEDIKHRFEPHSFIERPTDNHKLTVPVVNQELTTEEAGCSKIEPTAWNGQGFPPVGAVCEYRLADDSLWFKCEVRYVLDNNPSPDADYWTAVIWCPHLKMEQVVRDGKVKFRPIKSDRERWITEAQKASSDILSSRQLGKIYDAGLAKLPE